VGVNQTAPQNVIVCHKVYHAQIAADALIFAITRINESLSERDNESDIRIKESLSERDNESDIRIKESLSERDNESDTRKRIKT
jgi:dynactin complex subunit